MQKKPNDAFIGNNAAIDFVNTQGIEQGALVDRLADGDALVRWAAELGRPIGVAITKNDLAAAKELRTALRELFLAKIEDRRASKKTLSHVNAHLKHYELSESLTINSQGEFTLAPDSRAASLPVFLARLAYDAAMILSSNKASQIKRCASADCVLLFLDTSRAKKRRWCSMEVCGNRAKAASHYLRHQ